MKFEEFLQTKKEFFSYKENIVLFMEDIKARNDDKIPDSATLEDWEEYFDIWYEEEFENDDVPEECILTGAPGNWCQDCPRNIYSGFCNGKPCLCGLYEKQLTI